jgi:hypothetical protein
VEGLARAEMAMLTPKFSTGRSLVCGPSLVKKSIQKKESFLQKDSAKRLAVGSLLPFGKETVCTDFAGLRDDVSRAEGTNGWISNRT